MAVDLPKNPTARTLYNNNRTDTPLPPESEKKTLF